MTGNRLISIPFATISDPLVTDPDGIDFFLPALKETMAATRSAYAEIRTAFNKESIARNTAFKCSSVYKYHFLTLERPIDDIYKALHRTCVRQNISRAVKSGLEIRRAGNIDDVRIFYRLYYGTRKDLLLPSMPLSFFESIWSLLSPIGAVSFLIAELYGKPVASVMLFKFNRRVSGEAMGWDTSYINIRPVAFLYWEAIKMAHSEGYDVFDFGRTDPSNVSLMEFKNRWGTEVSDLTSYIFPAAAVHNRLRKSGAAFSLLRKFIFRSPDSLYRLISALCYRHLG
ncbi:MAG: GNAT family N-acetyltransferase [Chitinispirillaceae bacterium]|nr:GNAT family N-acetyltransferase [Chitinispirillaceae bacterium]